MQKRYFIVGPTTRGISEGDHLYIVCSTSGRKSFANAYYDDDFIDELYCGSLQEAREECRKLFGCKRPFVLD